MKTKRTIKTALLAAVTCLCCATANASVFQAEDYSAHFDTTPENIGGAYRSDSVDIEATSDAGGGHNVGWIEAGEWLAFNSLNIGRAGNFTIRLRVASEPGGVASVDLNAGAIPLGNFQIPPTGGWQRWRTVSRTVFLNAGNYDLGVFAQTGGWNLNWIEIVPEDGGSANNGIVTVYQDCNYEGWSVGLNEGSYNLSQLLARGFVNDDASSFRIAKGYEAVLYQDSNFNGSSIVLSSDDNCVFNEGFNDITSSMVVRRQGAAPPPSPPPPQTGFSAIVSEAQFNQMFPNRNPFYTYEGLVNAVRTYPAFAGASDINAAKREAAAALANFSHETGSFVFKEEIARNLYCGDWDNNPATCPCAPGKMYFGRGPIQLSWNGNYCAAGDALGLNLRANPDLVSQNATVAWQTALWFWMTQSGAGVMSPHAAMTIGPGFGETIRSINGALECNGGNAAQVQSRINEYQRIIGILGTTPGNNLSC